MLSKLMQVTGEQDEIIKMQSGIINELFMQLCLRIADEDLLAISPLLHSINDVAKKGEKDI